jgi:hypothetical protein
MWGPVRGIAMTYKVDLHSLSITDEPDVMMCTDGKISRSVNAGRGSRTSIEDPIDSRRAYFQTFAEARSFANTKWHEKINALESALIAAHQDYAAFMALQ